MIHTLRAELTKALTLRGVQATLAAATLAPPVLALASGLAFDPSSTAGASSSVESHGFETAGFGQPLVILLAALVTGTEYVDGQLRSTLVVDPHRERVLAAKFMLIAGAATAIGLVATTAAVIVERAVIGVPGQHATQFTAGMAWNVIGVAVNYTLIGLIAAALTVLARSLVVTLVILVPLVLGITLSLAGLLPVLRYLPDLAGIQLLTDYPGIGLLDAVPGGLVMAGWAVVLLALSVLVFRRRDA